jgi:hypothetical protein
LRSTIRWRVVLIDFDRSGGIVTRRRDLAGDAGH